MYENDLIAAITYPSRFWHHSNNNSQINLKTFKRGVGYEQA